jgi:sugar lactone lactonase YvrE
MEARGRLFGALAIGGAVISIGCHAIRETHQIAALGMAVDGNALPAAVQAPALAANPAMTREEFTKRENDPRKLKVNFHRRTSDRKTQAIVGAFAYEIRAIYTEAIVRSMSNLADFHMGVKAQPNSLYGYSLNVPPPGSTVPEGTVGVGVLRYAQHPTLDDPIYPSLVDPTKAINPVTGPGLYFLAQGILKTDFDGGFPPPVRDVFGDFPSTIVADPKKFDNIKLGMGAVEALLNGLWINGITYTDASGSHTIPSFVQDRPLTDNRSVTMTRYYKWKIPFDATSADFGDRLPLGRIMMDIRVVGENGDTITFGTSSATLGLGDNAINVITWDNKQALVAQADIGLPLPEGPQIGPAQTPEPFIAPTPAPTPRPGRRYSIVSTIAGRVGLEGLIDGFTNVARFRNPNAGAIDASGSVYVTDFDNSVIRVITRGASGSFTTVRTVPGSASLLKPSGIAVDAAGNLFIADHEHSAIVKLAPNGQLTTLASGIGKPRGVVVRADGTVFFASDTLHFIGKISPAGQVTRLAGSNAGNVDGTGESAKFFNPYGIALDPRTGDIIVADSTNSTIRRVTQAGVVTTIAGTSRGDLQDPKRLDHPTGVAVDKFGNIYITNTQEHMLKTLTVDNQTEELAGITDVSGHQDGDARQAKFNLPFGISIDASGDLYVFEAGNDVIRLIR